MKKIISIFICLAVVFAAFSQTVSVTNTVSTEPAITIDGGTNYWGFTDDYFLREEVVGEAITADGRARVKGKIRFDLQTLDPAESSILSFKPRWSWNSAANANDGNRSRVAALLKPADCLEVGIGNLAGVGYAFKLGPNFSGNGWTDDYNEGWNTISGIVGNFENIHMLIKDGIQVSYIGVPGLKVGFGLRSANGDRNTMIKKGMFNGAALGAKYSADLFEVGAKWAGNFGAETGYLADQNDKAYQDHTFYAAATFKGLQEAKIGTTIHAGVGFYTAKASKVKNTKLTTAFLFDVGAGFDFRNGISDDVNVAVGYNKIDGTTSKVLPFCVRNTLTYEASSDATFTFELCYAQAGLKEKKQVAGAANTNSNTLGPAGAANTPTVDDGYGWLVAAVPTFEFTMGAHTFSMGVKSVVLGDIVPHAKSGHEWSWTGLRGQEANISFPLSWSYEF
ncbi:MAG: hypothetical protein IKZ86_04910 [Spirochaetaceae bacterium]|nr:hypothetical protein [Spirochaetaceae bacterium]